MSDESDSSSDVGDIESYITDTIGGLDISLCVDKFLVISGVYRV